MAGREEALKAPAWSSTWATATAGRAATATSSTRRARTVRTQPDHGRRRRHASVLREGPIAESIRLAPNAVVLNHHLCYASGNSEPGLSEGTMAIAKQRVDNFAAGFVVAGLRPSSLRRTTTRTTCCDRSWPGAAASSRPGAAPRRPTATVSPSRARAVRAMSRRWTRTIRGPGSPGRSCSRRDSRRATSSPRPVVGSGAAATQASKQRRWCPASSVPASR